MRRIGSGREVTGVCLLDDGGSRWWGLGGWCVPGCLGVGLKLRSVGNRVEVDAAGRTGAVRYAGRVAGCLGRERGNGGLGKENVKSASNASYLGRKRTSSDKEKTR